MSERLRVLLVDDHKLFRSGVKALVGLIPVEGGSTIRFALLLESPGVDDEKVFKPLWEGVLTQALGTYPQGPTPEAVAPLPATPNGS